eukprot:1125237-Amphidinium_carterae.1
MAQHVADVRRTQALVNCLVDDGTDGVGVESVGLGGGVSANDDGVWLEVVGVVAAHNWRLPRSEARRHGSASMCMLVRSSVSSS